MLLGASAFAQSDDWERVPSDSDHGAATARRRHAQRGCAKKQRSHGMQPSGRIGRAIGEAARHRRDRAITARQYRESQRHTGQLSIRSRLSADTAGTLRAELHRQINYVHAPREVTPAQLGARARETCENPENVGTPVAPPPSPG